MKNIRVILKKHVPHFHEFQSETHRGLKRSGLAVHIVTSGVWGFWTNITDVLKYWRLPIRYSEHARNALTEVFVLGSNRWRAQFERTGWQVQTRATVGLFYTGNLIFDRKLPIGARVWLNRLLGSSCNVFALRHG
jgi:hypothetical protein